MARLAVNAIAGFSLAVAMLALGVGSADAQDARERQSASEAYDRGTAAFLARDYANAGRWFETAHRLAPAAAALVQAARSYQRAGDDLRAATIGLRLEALYPNDRSAQRAAQEALRHARRFVRVDVACEGCTLALDGAVMEHPSFFVEPGADHVVEAAFETGSLSETVRGQAGEQRALRFEAPPAPIVVEEPEPLPVVEPPPVEPRPEPSGGGVPMAVTIGAAVVTAALGAVLIWSGVDTLDGVPAYEMNPTQAALADGQSREERTNWLIAGTSLAAAATLVLAIFTDWGTGSSGEAEISSLGVDLAVQADGVMGALRGRF